MGRLLWRYESPRVPRGQRTFQGRRKLLKKLPRLTDRVSTKIITLNWWLHLRKSSSSSSSGFKGNWLPHFSFNRLFCQTSAYYGLTLWMSKFLVPWVSLPSLMLLMIGLAEIPGLIVILLLKYYNSSNRFCWLWISVCGGVEFVSFLANDTKSFVLSFLLLILLVSLVFGPFCKAQMWHFIDILSVISFYIYIFRYVHILKASRPFIVLAVSQLPVHLVKSAGCSMMLFGYLFKESKTGSLFMSLFPALFLTGASFDQL